MTEIEAVILTGGASTRMGADKAKLEVLGEAQAVRIANLLTGIGLPVTFLGPHKFADYPHQADQDRGAGPLAAIASFAPKSPSVFVVSCDLPAFDPHIVSCLRSALGPADAAMPKIDGRQQTLCGLYRDRCFPVAAEVLKSGDRRVRAWVSRLYVKDLDEAKIQAAGIAIEACLSANSPDEFERLAAFARNHQLGKSAQ